MRLLLLIVAATGACLAQTSTDIIVSAGADSSRPGFVPRATYSLGVGHTFAALKQNPLGDELTFSYTYENGGSHGFFHADAGFHDQIFGLMKNIDLPRTKKLAAYTCLMGGNTVITGGPKLLDRIYGGAAAGVSLHITQKTAVWLQESFNKVATVPWYLNASVNYVYSF